MLGTHQDNKVAESPDNLQKLLNQFGLKEINLTQEGINLNTLKFALNPTVYGKIIHFLMTTPIVLSPLRWAWVQLCEMNNTDAPLIDLEENQEKKESPLLVVNRRDESTELLPTAKNPGIIFTSHAYLLDSQTRLRAVFGINAFYEAAEEAFVGIWSALVTSLIIQGTYIFSNYTNERGNSSLWDALGFGVHAESQYAVALASVLNEIYIWPFIVGIPLLLGTIKGLYGLKQANIFADEEIEQIRQHEPSFWIDSLGWILAIALPDLFAILGCMFAILPQPQIRFALENIRNHLIWDGRLSNEKCQELFNALLDFSDQSTQLTQLKALAVLADIVEGISIDNLQLLHDQGIDQEIILTMLESKLRALEKLQHFAKNYNLPGKPPQVFRPLLRFLFANYLLWTLGYPEGDLKNIVTQPLFFLHKGIRFYFWVVFTSAMKIGFSNIYDNYIHGKQCHDAGKIWLWYEAFNKYICSRCGDLPISFQDIFTVESCFQGYLNLPRTLKEIEIFIKRFNISNVTRMELLQQTYIFQQGELPQLLEMLKPKLPRLRVLIIQSGSIIQEYIFTTTDVAAIAQFVQNSSVVSLNFINAGPADDDAFKLIGYVLPNTILNKLDLSAQPPITRANPQLLAKGLENHPALKELHLIGNKLGINGTTVIATVLPSLKKLETLDLDFTIDFLESTDACKIVATQVPKARELRHLSYDNPMDSACLEAFASILVELKYNFSLFLSAYDNGYDDTGYSCDSGVKAFAQALARSPVPPLEVLVLPFFNVTQKTFLEFIQTVSHSQLRLLHIVGMSMAGVNNFTALIPDVVNALNGSRISDFSWNSYDPTVQAWGNAESDIFFSSLPTKLPQITNVDLSNNNIDQNGIPAITVAASNSNLQSLTMIGNLIRGISALAKNLGNITKLILSLNQLDLNDAIALANTKNSKLRVLDISFNFALIEEAVLTIFEGAHGSSLNEFNFDGINISDVGMGKLAKLLIKEQRHPLWIEYLKNKGKRYNEIPATNLSALTVAIGAQYNNSDKALTALCAVLSQANLSLYNLSLDLAPDFNLSDPALRDCGIISGANSLQPFFPYLLLARISLTAKNSLLTILVNQYKLLIEKSTVILMEDDVCFSENNNLALAEFQPRGTEVQLLESNCDFVADQYALEEAQAETFQANTSLLYNSLLSICETFVNSVSKSVLLSAVPKFITELFYHAGGFTRPEAEAFGQQIQFELMLSVNDSPAALSASFLAAWTASHLTRSPQIITKVSMGAGIVTNVAAALWTQDVSFSWLALQTGVALMGATLGGVLVEKAEQDIRRVLAWGWTKASAVKQCANSYFSFWAQEKPQDEPEEIKRVGCLKLNGV